MSTTPSTTLHHAERLETTSLTITVSHRADMDRQLEEGVTLLRQIAEREGTYQGIIATRHSAAKFTLELNPSVPFGITCERQAWH